MMLPSSVPDEPGIDYLAETDQRIRWANDDGAQFQAGCEWFGEANAYGVLVEAHGNRWEAKWHRFIDPDIEAQKFTELSRLLGSFLDHSRAALNYATYQLALCALRENPALEGKLNPDAVEFPIFQDPKLFKQKNRIQKLPQQYRDAIEAVQPYGGRYPGLWFLHELARAYRHRVLHPTTLVPSNDLHHVLVNGTLVHLPDLEIIPYDRLEHGRVVMRFTLDVDANANVHPQVATLIAIDHVLCRHLQGMRVLNEVAEAGDAALSAIQALIYPRT